MVAHAMGELPNLLKLYSDKLLVYQQQKTKLYAKQIKALNNQRLQVRLPSIHSAKECWKVNGKLPNVDQ